MSQQFAVPLVLAVVCIVVGLVVRAAETRRGRPFDVAARQLGGSTAVRNVVGGWVLAAAAVVMAAVAVAHRDGAAVVVCVLIAVGGVVSASWWRRRLRR